MESSAFAFVLLAMSPSMTESNSCTVLQHEIEAKLKTKGVSAYRLDIVPASAVGSGYVIGSCEAGKKKILYRK